MTKRCSHPRVNWTVRSDGIVQIATCHYCLHALSLGNSNDSISTVELMLAEMARGDEFWEHMEWVDADALAWDVTRPLAEQWPWSGAVDDSEACLAHQAADDRQIEKLIRDSHADAVPPDGWKERVLEAIDNGGDK